MKRLRRWLFNLAAGVSLALCMVLVVAAIRSAFVLDYVIIPSSFRADKINTFALGAGGVTAVRRRVLSPAAVQLSGWTHTTGLPNHSWDSWLGFHFRFTSDGWDTRFPYWLLILLTGVPLPFSWYLYHRRLRQAAMIGKCRVCGYDLRATPDRCPECGAVPEAAKGAAG